MRVLGKAVLAAASALLGSGLLTATPAAAATTVYYVAPAGDDAAAGTSLAAPFKTISRCASVAVAGDTCLIRGGTYRETVKPTNSGTAAARITFAPYQGESVTVSGADVVTGWTRHAGDVYVASVDLPVKKEVDDTVGAVAANQVFVDSTMAGEAQWPNGTTDPSHAKTATADAGSGVSLLVDSDLPSGVDFTGAVEHVVGGPGWTASANRVASTAPGKLTITRNCSDPNCTNPGAKYYLTGGNNGLQLLDTPGEWWYDGAAGKLYLWAPGGGSPATRAVEAKKRNNAFDLSDRSYVSVTGLKIFSATVTTSSTSTNDILDGLGARYVSHSLSILKDPQDTNNCGIWCSHATDLGIQLNGSGHILRNSTIGFSAGNGVSASGSNLTVTNNLIHDVSYLGNYASGVNFGFQGFGTVTDNTMRTSGRFLISLNPGQDYAHRSEIARNNLYDYGIQTRDLGAVYVCCHTVDGQNTQIHHNWMHDSSVADAYSAAVMLDDGASGFVAHHNVSWATGRFGLKLNATGSGSDGSLTDSLYSNTVAPGVGYSVAGSSTDATGSAVQNNLMAHGSVPFERSFPNATVTPNSDPLVRPRYVNPTVHDFRVQPGAPSIDKGVVVAGVTDGYQGSAPDHGAYEQGAPDWTAGCSLPACRAGTDAYLGIAAASYTSQAGTQLEDSAAGGQDVAFVSSGDRTSYAGVALPSGAAAMTVQVASATTGGTIEAHRDTPAGALLATCTVPNTGGWQRWTTVTCPVTGAGGTHDLHLVYKGGTGNLFNVGWFRFTTAPVTAVDPYAQVEAELFDGQAGTSIEWASGGSGSDVAYISNGDTLSYVPVAFGATSPSALTVRTANAGAGTGTVEAHLDSATGPLVATCSAPPTGNWQAYSSQSCPVSGVTGSRPLYLVAKGGSGNLFNFDWFRFAA